MLNLDMNLSLSEKYISSVRMETGKRDFTDHSLKSFLNNFSSRKIKKNSNTIDQSPVFGSVKSSLNKIRRMKPK